MTIVACPQCGDQVTVPPGTSGEARVRCPLCREEYLLATALRRLPPPLEVLEPDRPRDVSDHFDHGAASPAGEFQAEVLDYGRAAGAEGRAPRASRPAGGHATPPSVAAFELQPETASRRPLTTGRRSRRRRPTSSPLRAIFQVVGGGVLGLMLAQFILWWMPGNWERANRDPFGLADRVAGFAPFLLPSQLRPIDGSAAFTDEAAPPDDGRFSFGPAETTTAGGQAPSDPASPPSRLEHTETAAERATHAAEGGQTVTTAAEEHNTPAPPPADPARGPQHAKPAQENSAPADPFGGKSPPRPSHDRTLEDQVAAVQSALREWETATTAPREQKTEALVSLYDGLSRFGARCATTDRAVVGQLLETSGLGSSLDQLARHPQTPIYLARYAARWLDQPQREHAGALVFGTVASRRPIGNVIETHLRLASLDEREVVIVQHASDAPALPAGRRVLVVGFLTDNPAQYFPDYVGTAAPVMVLGTAFTAGSP